MTEPASERLPDELATRLDQFAASVDRPKSWVIEQAIARYLEAEDAGSIDRPESWVIEQAVARYLEEEVRQVQAIAEALEEYERGKATLHPHDEVMGRLEQRIREHIRNADTVA